MNAVVLLAEDDPVSRVFLTEALASFGLRCDAVDDGMDAVQRARSVRYDALLLDLNLPGCDGMEILAILRADAAALSRLAPALALTADDSERTTQRLVTVGFAAVANKPIGFDRLAGALRELGLGITQCESIEIASDRAEPPLSPWDDAQALSAAGGSHDIVAALRTMMRAELPAQRASIAAALQRGDADAARAELHRLRASCGFCGATALASSTDALHAALSRDGDLAGSSNRFFADLDRLVWFA